MTRPAAPPQHDPMSTTLRTPDPQGWEQYGETVESSRPEDPAGGTLDPALRRLGRFVVLREIGRGAMGVVFSAYDETLDRKVALKRVRVSDDRDGAAARNLLLREAQALARLTHPNVVTVYECGVVSDEVFIAMEFVQGADLKAWLALQPRRWDDVLALQLQAGAGLLAAHERGLVHRDFKPGNVLVGDDGRVRVADFGLAGLRARDPEPASISASPRPLDRTLASYGALVGTPAYMAPELFRHEPATPRSDQWAFCVTLWEALYEQRPFAGKDSLELATLVDTLDLPRSPPRAQVPAALHAALLRGLRRDPAARYPGMAELLAALSPRPSRARAWALAGALAGAAGLAAGLGLSMRDPPCPDVQVLQDTLLSDARARAIDAAFAREELPSTGARVLARLREQARAWAAGEAQVCAESRAASVDPRLLDARRQCLDRVRGRVDALADALGRADAAATRRAQEQLDALPPAAACRALALTDIECQPTPSDPAARTAAEPAWRRLEAASQRELAGDVRGAIDEVRAAAAILAELPAIGARIHARAHLGRLLYELDDPGAALEALSAARDDAEQLHCDDILFDIYGRMIQLATYNPDLDRGEARAWTTLQALRAGRAPDAGTRAALALGRGLLAFFRDGDLDAAAAALSEARALFEGAGETESRRYADALRTLGLVALERDAFDDAFGLFSRGRDAWAAATSPRDPGLWRFEFNLGLIARLRDETAEARQHFRRGLELAEAGLGRRSVPVARCLVMLASLAEREDLGEEALRDAAEAAAIAGAVFPPGDPRRAEFLEAHAGLLTSFGRSGDAVAVLREILRLRAGAPPAELAWTHYALSRALLTGGDAAGALPHAEFAAEHAQGLTGSGVDLASHAALQRGWSLVELGRPREALGPLERATAGFAAHPAEAANLALARFCLARALCAAGERGARPGELARAALPAASSLDQKKIEAWLATSDCQPHATHKHRRRSP